MSDKNNQENVDKYLDSLINPSEDDAGTELANRESGDVKEYESQPVKIFDEADSESAENDATNIFDFGKHGQTQNVVFDDRSEEKIPQPIKKNVKKKRRRKNYSAYGGIVLATLVLCASIVLSLFVIVVGRDVLGIETADNSFTIYIPEGSSTKDIANQLYGEGVIHYKKVFVALAKVKEADGNMCPGDIEVAYNMSYSDLIDSLVEMRDAKKTATITFVEGITINQAAKLLEENDVCSASEFIYYFNSSVFGYEFERYVSNSSLKLYKYEGYLFPDTYEFYVGDSAYNVVKKIKQRTNEILSPEAISRAQSLGYTIDEVVTLASIVQKEAGSVDDMKNIASVFINRLNAPEEYPKLQSDTTYSYIENDIKSVMTIEYQDMYDAYDTYTCLGLPIGAICNPGADAVNAVLYPAETQYYYFCSNINTKETFYAKTYSEHLANCEAAGIRAD